MTQTLPAWVYTKTNKDIRPRKTLSMDVLAALFTVAPKWKPPQCPPLKNG